MWCAISHSIGRWSCTRLFWRTKAVIVQRLHEKEIVALLYPVWWRVGKPSSCVLALLNFSPCQQGNHQQSAAVTRIDNAIDTEIGRMSRSLISLRENSQTWIDLFEVNPRMDVAKIYPAPHPYFLNEMRHRRGRASKHERGSD